MGDEAQRGAAKPAAFFFLKNKTPNEKTTMPIKDELGPCLKCGEGYVYGGLWCARCAAAHPSEYAPLRRAWVLARRSQLLATAGVPAAFRRCGLDTFETRTPDQRRALDALQSWAKGGRARGLYLHGTVGTGKTHLAIGAVLELLAQRDLAARYVSARELVLDLREAYSSNAGAESVGTVLRKCTEGIGALVLDDMAAGKSTEFVGQCIDVLVDRAYCQRRPLLIVTSNLDLAQLGRHLDERIADRLRELCMEVRVSGVSFRRRIASHRNLSATTQG